MNIPDDTPLLDGERNNIVYLVLRFEAGWGMRDADFAVIESLCDKSLTGSAAIQDIIHRSCEYAWDHLLGEPDTPTAEDIERHATLIIEQWFAGTTQAERSNIN